MTQFAVSTTDGKTVVVDSEQTTAVAVAETARAAGYLDLNERVAATGRDTLGHNQPVVIPYHAIVAIRPKR